MSGDKPEIDEMNRKRKSLNDWNIRKGDAM